MRIAALVFAAAMMAAAPALAQTEPAAPAPTVTEEATAPAAGATEEAATEAPADNDGARQVCRNVERSESRLRSRRERICATQAQWEQMERDAANGARRAGSIQRAQGS